MTMRIYSVENGTHRNYDRFRSLAKKKRKYRAFLSRKNISEINWWNQSSNEYNHENISFLKLLWRIVNSSQFRKFQAHSVWGSRNALSRNKFSFSTMANLAEYKINDNSSNARIFLLRTRTVDGLFRRDVHWNLVNIFYIICFAPTHWLLHY